MEGPVIVTKPKRRLCCCHSLSIPVHPYWALLFSGVSRQSLLIFLHVDQPCADCTAHWYRQETGSLLVSRGMEQAWGSSVGVKLRE